MIAVERERDKLEPFASKAALCHCFREVARIRLCVRFESAGMRVTLVAPQMSDKTVVRDSI